jgi:hypothetical protein
MADSDRVPPMNVLVNPLPKTDLAEADRIFRIAFGTFLGLPNPTEFFGDADYVRTRWVADPSAAFGAYIADELVGSNFAARWGSVAFFGPLTVRPDHWDKGHREETTQTDSGPYGDLGSEARRSVHLCP